MDTIGTFTDLDVTTILGSKHSEPRMCATSELTIIHRIHQPSTYHTIMEHKFNIFLISKDENTYSTDLCGAKIKRDTP